MEMISDRFQFTLANTSSTIREDISQVIYSAGSTDVVLCERGLILV